MTAHTPIDDGRAAPPGRVLLALMASVLFVALVVFAWGVLSLVLDLDVIAFQDAGPLIGPAMVAVSAALVFRLVVRSERSRQPIDMLLAALGPILVAPLVGAVVLSIASARFAAFPVYLAGFVLSPFALAAGILAAAVVGGFGLIPRRS